jgi:pimeloyl-ACP methyl ester carboxylesterase
MPTCSKTAALCTNARTERGGFVTKGEAMKAVDPLCFPNPSLALEPPPRSRLVGTDPQIAYTIYEPQNLVSEWQIGFLAGVAHKQNCWAELARALAQCGLRCFSLDYRGVGLSTWSQPVQAATLDDCVADLAAVLDAAGVDPRRSVLIGHSYGGGVAQRYAQQYEVGGLILMDTLALGLWWKDVLRQLPYQLSHHPRLYWQLSKDPSALFATEARAREYLFGQDTPAPVVRWYLDECWCPASGRALQQMLFARPAPLRTSHLLFLAGHQDASVSPRLIRQSATRMQAPLIEMPGPHDVMLVDGWEWAVAVLSAALQQWEEDAA